MPTKHKHRNSFDLADDVEKIKAALLETSRDIQGRAGEILTGSVDDVKEYTSAVKDNFLDYTSEQPLKSLGIALFVGIVLGLFIRR